MGKTVILESSIFSHLDFSNSAFSYGIIIGQSESSAQEVDHIISCFECPNDEGDDDDNAKGEGKKSNSNKKFKWDVSWITQHTVNVYRMLPGGLFVRGLYIYDPHHTHDISQPIFKKILLGIYHAQSNYLTDINNSNKPVLNAEQLLLYLDPKTKKHIGKLLTSCDENTAALRQFVNVDVKCKPFIQNWNRFTIHLNISVEAALPKERTKDRILHELHHAVRPFVHKVILNGQLLVNGDLLPPDHTMDKITPRLQTDEDDDEEEDDNKSLVQLIFVGQECPEFPYVSESSAKEKSMDRLLIQGQLPGLAFLPNNCTVGQLSRELKNDIIRSIFTRLDLLTDELQLMGGELNTPKMLLPRRVLIKLPRCQQLPLSDYKFLSETNEDVLNRLRFFCRMNLFSATSLSLNEQENDAAAEGDNDIEDTCIDDSLEPIIKNDNDNCLNENDALGEDTNSDTTVVRYSLPLASLGALFVLLLAVLVYYLYDN